MGIPFDHEMMPAINGVGFERLIAADWLEEQGESAFADAIRTEAFSDGVFELPSFGYGSGYGSGSGSGYGSGDGYGSSRSQLSI
jgi:hypothetical protein